MTSPAGRGTVDLMTAEPCEAPSTEVPYEVIHLGGQTAAVVPLDEIRRLRALESTATAEQLAEAEEAAAYIDWREREAAGLTSYVSMDEAWRRLGLTR